jgi:chaperonin cofactor prefoldin
MRERQRECSLQVSFLEQQLEATKTQMENLETQLQEISLYVEEIPNINNKHIEYSNTGLRVDRSSSIATRVLAIRNQNLQLVRIGILDR